MYVLVLHDRARVVPVSTLSILSGAVPLQCTRVSLIQHPLIPTPPSCLSSRVAINFTRRTSCSSHVFWFICIQIDITLLYLMQLS
jgi:hypothetical protein